MFSASSDELVLTLISVNLSRPPGERLQKIENCAIPTAKTVLTQFLSTTKVSLVRKDAVKLRIHLSINTLLIKY